MDHRTYYALTLKELGYLYEKKKDYKKAMNAFMNVKEFDARRGVKLSLGEYDKKIDELQKLISRQTQ